MFSRFGLRARMAASYVLVSAAAVLVVEAILLAVMLPRVRAATDAAERADQRAAQAELGTVQIKADATALETATQAAKAATVAAVEQPGRSDEALLVIAAAAVPREADTRWVLATVAGRPVGGGDAPATLPAGAAGAAGAVARTGVTTVGGRSAGWAIRPVELTDVPGRGVIGVAYVALVMDPGVAKPVRDPAGKAGRGEQAVPGLGDLVLPGAVVLGLLLPVGALFGLLSTGPLIRRIRRLAAGTSAMADGDLRTRLPVSGDDEVGRLEQGFNAMAERLDAAVHAERTAAGADARRAERARIARELHDSISQDLFSASLLAGGLRKALPADSALRRQAAVLEDSLERTKREMRALLLELRPVALEDACLADALGSLCRAYQERLGIPITTRIEPPPLEAPVEHAVLRVVQEALGNAVRHGEPGTIELAVGGAGDGRVAVTVRDDGRGFDPAGPDGPGMGLALMRDRVGELGGTVAVTSAPERGTTVRVLLPAGAA